MIRFYGLREILCFPRAVRKGKACLEFNRPDRAHSGFECSPGHY
jgi:hypothetical protein